MVMGLALGGVGPVIECLNAQGRRPDRNLNDEVESKKVSELCP